MKENECGGENVLFLSVYVCFESQKKRKKKLWKTYEKEKLKRKERKEKEFVPPCCSKDWVFIQKWILSWFKCFAHYFFKNLCFPYPFFVIHIPQAPLQPLTSILSVMYFNCGVWTWYELMVSLVLASK